MMQTVNLNALPFLAATMPAAPAEKPTTKGLQARAVLHECVAALIKGDYTPDTLDLIKAALGSKAFAYLQTPEEQNTYLLTKLALIEARALKPRPGKGETERYFEMLLKREMALTGLFEAKTEKVKTGLIALAAFYHALAAIDRFTQPEAAEPQTVADARATVEAIWAKHDQLFAYMTPEQRAAIQADYEAALFT